MRARIGGAPCALGQSRKKIDMTRSKLLLVIVCAALCAPSAVCARDADSARGPHLDFEVDPLAFIAKGFSVHAGVRWDRYRLDVGAFGAEIPGFLANDDRFESRFAGYGLKLDYRFFVEGDGPFVGISGSRVRTTVTHKASGDSDSFHQHEVSVRAGYQFDVWRGLYVVPWVGVGYMFDPRSPSLGGMQQKEQSHLVLFPTLHLGYRFE